MKPTQPVDRCERCNWPIVPEGEAGCWKSNCSMRPMPPLPKTVEPSDECDSAFEKAAASIDWKGYAVPSVIVDFFHAGWEAGLRQPKRESVARDDIYAAIRKSGRAIAYGAHVKLEWLYEAGFKITRIEGGES